MPPFLSVFGRKPVALSYAYGNDSFKDYQTQYLGARNSGTDGNTNYGRECGNHPEAYQPECFKSRKSTLRWYDETVALIRANNQVGGILFDHQIDKVRGLIEDTKNNHGWINNFTHWHNVVRDGNLNQYAKYVKMLAEMNTSGDIAFLGYGEALAYMVFREIIENVDVSIENDRLRIILHCNTRLPIDYDLLQVPVTVRVTYGEKNLLLDIPFDGQETSFETKLT